jgi:hypothetical protein
MILTVQKFQGLKHDSTQIEDPEMAQYRPRDFRGAPTLFGPVPVDSEQETLNGRSIQPVCLSARRFSAEEPNPGRGRKD